MRVTTRVGNSSILLKNYEDVSLPDMDVGHMAEFISVIEGSHFDAAPLPMQSIASIVGVRASSWPLLCNESARDDHISKISRRFLEALTDASSHEYFLTWLRIRKFLDSFEPATVSVEAWQKFASENCHGDDFLSGNKLQIPKYATDGSSTGRLTVTSGPNYLTLAKTFRSTLKPSSPGQSVVNIDFVSLEPRVAMWHARLPHPDGDVYENVMGQCGLSDRSTAKLATLSALYGASISKLSEQLGNRKRAQDLVTKVRSIFRVEKLESTLESQAACGIVRNAFGRPLREATLTERVRVNHFLQSTAAEMAVVMFSEICEAFSNARPIAVIHDALVLEIPTLEMEKFVSACESESWQGFPFPVKCDVISQA